MIISSQKDYFPLVSIAMAVRNGQPFLRAQIDSLLTQTYRNLEIVISDDQSTDDTPKILEEYTKIDNRIRWTSNPHPAGLSKNFERVFSQCKGEIIFPCDADDIWYSERIEKHVKIYSDPKIGWVYNKSILVDKDGRPLGSLEDSIPEYYVKKRNMRENAWGACIGGIHASYRSGVLKKALPLDPEAQAYDAWIQLAIYPARSVFIDEVLLAWRRHGGNESVWGGNYSKEEYEKREREATNNNLRLIKSIIRNKNLLLWKRFYFLVIFCGKSLRFLTKRVVIF